MVTALFKSFPRNESSMDYALLVKEMVENKSFRILSDPQVM